MFAEFEEEIHSAVENGEVLTSGMLNEKYSDLKQKYYQNADVDDRIEKEWMRIPHFYYNFYVFQYATGISAATSIREKIVQDGRNEDYLEFLSSGGSDYPLNTLKIMNIEADRDTFEEAIEEYRRYLERAEELFLN